MYANWYGFGVGRLCLSVRLCRCLVSVAHVWARVAHEYMATAATYNMFFFFLNKIFEVFNVVIVGFKAFVWVVAFMCFCIWTENTGGQRRPATDSDGRRRQARATDGQHRPC